MKRFPAFVFSIAVFSVGTSLADAQTVLTADAIRANVRAAAGVPPQNETVMSTFVHGGTTGTAMYRRLGKDLREDDVLGPVHTAYGKFDGVPWRQNGNGQVVIHSDLPEEPVTEARTTIVEHVMKPQELYVVSDLTRQGRGTKEYVDPLTWRVIRQDVISATETTTTTYADFRLTAGYTRAWQQVTSDGHHENDETSTILTDQAGAVTAEQVAIPNDAHAVVTFPVGRTFVQLPTRYDEDSGKFVVRVTIGSRGLDFALDTGASGIFIDRDVAQSLRIPELTAYSSPGGTGRFSGATAIVPSMLVGDLEMHDVVVGTTPNVGEDGPEYKVVGVLGFDFIRDVGLKLDYKARTVTAYAPSTTAPPPSRHRIELSVNLGSFVPLTSVTINGETGTRFIVDTGGAGPLMVTGGFRRRHPNALVDENHRQQPMSFGGMGGEIDGALITLNSYEIGTTKFVDSPAYVVDTDAAFGADRDGLIGPTLLSHFTVYLDFSNYKVYLDR
jgi:predicted aspartyl protease